MELAIGNPALTLSLALVVGGAAQTLARHLRMPGIVLLLAAGALLGPDVLGVIDPRTLGPALPIIVGFAVAVILFEGGMNLNARRLWNQAVTIRRLIIIGGAITALGGTLLGLGVMGWDWPRAVLFGTLVTVTGPTVITPLLRRVRVGSRLQTILEAEGVFIDAVGAITAIAALEIAVGHVDAGALESATVFLERFGTGCAAGLIGGGLIALLFRVDWLIPEELDDVIALSVVFLLFQVSNAVMPESGIAAAAVAGITVGNVRRTRALRELLEFKEQLTVMLIGLLFVLLAADVRFADVRSLGWPGMATVLALMFVVRPLNIAICARGSDLTRGERAFLAWLAPRGIVAAAVASFFAQEMEEAGIAGGSELRALVFLVIAVTVLVQGMTGGMVARLLGVRRPSNEGYVILGVTPLGLALAEALRHNDEDIVFLDSNPSAPPKAQESGFRAVWGNALEEPTLQRATLDARAGAIGLTGNEEINFMFVRRALERFEVKNGWVALRSRHEGIKPGLVREEKAAILFGAPRDVDHWNLRLRRQEATVETWKLAREKALGEGFPADPGQLRETLLPIAVQRRGKTRPVDDQSRIRQGDVVYFGVMQAAASAARGWLTEHGWEPADRPTPETSAEPAAQPTARPAAEPAAQPAQDNE